VCFEENNLRLCGNLKDLTSFFPELEVVVGNDSVTLICDTCHNFLSLPFHERPSNFVAPKGGSQGCFSRGLIIKKDKFEKLLNGKSQDWNNFKHKFKSHFFDSSSNSCHKVAQEKLKKQNKASPTVMLNHMRAALNIIKNKSANQSFENELCTLKACGADVGNFGYSRKNLNDILKSINVILNEKFSNYLKNDLQCTSMRPHLFLTADKSTKHRITTQIVMLSCVIDGVRQAFPVDLIDVYDTCDGSAGTMSDLAVRAVSSIKDILNLESSDFNLIQGKAVDGQYIKGDFNSTVENELHQPLNLSEEENDYFMPIIWDSAHWIDLIFNKVRESENNKEFLNNFIEKISSINKMYHAGKFFALSELTANELKMEFKRIGSVAPHRFLSSNYHLMENLLKVLPVLLETFRDHKNSEDGEYLLGGQDFIFDLVCLVDILKPLRQLMLRAQKLNRPSWLILKDCQNALDVWEKMENELESREFKLMSNIYENYDDILNKQYKGVTIMEGWTKKTETFVTLNNKRRKVTNWDEREINDCIVDLKGVIKSLQINLKASMSNKVPELMKDLAHIFDFEAILFTLAQNEGVDEFKKNFYNICTFVKKLPHFNIFNNNDTLDAPEKFIIFCKALFFGDLKSFLPNIFTFNEHKHTYIFSSVKKAPDCDANLNRNLIFKTTTGEELIGSFNLDNFLKLLYCDPKFYKLTGNFFVAVFDLYFAKAGTEIVCETFFKYIEKHLMEGNQSNTTLFLRSKIDYVCPNVIQSTSLLTEAAKIFISGSEKHKISKHIYPVNSSFKNKIYDRFMNETTKFPFLLD